MQYRAEVDGLRAVAVLPVILFHAGISAFAGGYLGVDVFFVISGYLITTIIVDGLQSERGFSLLHFYERRVRRILPALALTILLTLAIAPFVLVPGQIKDVGQSVFATALFASNYFFYLEIDYFNPFAAQAPLLHTWSLAVEEQFYLLFPLLLMALHRTRVGYGWLIALVFVASFVAALVTVQSNPQLAFYSIHTRAWELAVGAGLGLWMRKLGAEDLRAGRPADLVSGAALVVLAISLMVVPKDAGHPGFVTLVPVFATALLIRYAQQGTLAHAILSHRIMVHIGLMSYGLYLYHNPLFSYVDVYFDYLGDGTTLYKLALIPLVYLMALASLHLVERPILRGTRVKRPFVLASAVAGIAAFAGAGLFIHVKNGFQSELTAFYQSRGMTLLADADKEQVLIEEIRAQHVPAAAPFDCAPGECRRFLFIGDSLSEDSYLAMASNSEIGEFRRVYMDDECMGGIVSVREIETRAPCMSKTNDFGNLLREADVILIAAKWQESTWPDGIELARLLRKELDKPVVVFGSAMFTDLASFSVKAWRNGYASDAELDEALYRYQRWDRLRISDKLRDAVADAPEIGWVSRHAFFCDRDKEVCKLFDEAGRPLIWDNAHLTVWGYPLYARYVEARLAELGI